MWSWPFRCRYISSCLCWISNQEKESRVSQLSIIIVISWLLLLALFGESDSSIPFRELESFALPPILFWRDWLEFLIIDLIIVIFFFFFRVENGTKRCFWFGLFLLFFLALPSLSLFIIFLYWEVIEMEVIALVSARKTASQLLSRKSIFVEKVVSFRNRDKNNNSIPTEPQIKNQTEDSEIFSKFADEISSHWNVCLHSFFLLNKFFFNKGSSRADERWHGNIQSDQTPRIPACK